MMHENRRRERDMKNNNGQKSPEGAPNSRSENNRERYSISDRRSRQSHEKAEINLLRENDLYERQDS